MEWPLRDDDLAALTSNHRHETPAVGREREPPLERRIAPPIVVAVPFSASFWAFAPRLRGSVRRQQQRSVGWVARCVGVMGRAAAPVGDAPVVMVLIATSRAGRWGFSSFMSSLFGVVGTEIGAEGALGASRFASQIAHIPRASC
jgi:hypothetical protein